MRGLSKKAISKPSEISQTVLPLFEAYMLLRAFFRNLNTSIAPTLFDLSLNSSNLSMKFIGIAIKFLSSPSSLVNLEKTSVPLNS